MFWINAESEESLMPGFIDIVRKLKPDVSIPDKVQDLLIVAKSLLEDRAAGQWLIVLDGADDKDVFLKGREGMPSLRRWLPMVSHGRILITTTDSRFNGLGSGNVIPFDNGFEVLSLSVKEGIQLLQHYIPSHLRVQSTEADIERLVKELGCLPLALTQAAAYIKEVGQVSIHDFHSAYVQARDNFNLFQYPDDSWEHKQHSILVTWDMAYRRIGGHTVPKHPSARMLDVISFLNPRRIPKSLLQKIYNTIDQTQNSIIDVMHQPLNLSLISYRADFEGNYSVHPVVHDWISHNIIDETERRWYFDKITQQLAHIFLMRVQAREKLFQDDEVDWTVYDNYLPHAISVIERTPVNYKSMNLADLLAYVGRFLSNQGFFRGAIKFLKGASSMRKDIVGQDDFEILLYELQIAYNMGDKKTIALSGRSLLHNVKERGRQALEGKELENLCSQLDVVRTYWNLQTGAFVDAETTSRKKLQASLKNSSLETSNVEDRPYSRESTFWRLNLAQALQGQKRFGEAERHAAEVVKNMTPGPKDKAPSELYLNAISLLASISKKRSNLDAAEQLSNEVLEYRRHALGGHHSKTIRCMYNLACVLVMRTTQDKLLQGEIIARRVAELSQQKMGLDQGYVVNPWNAYRLLAGLLEKQGKFEEARTVHRANIARSFNESARQRTVIGLARQYMREGRMKDCKAVFDEYEYRRMSRPVRRFIRRLGRDGFTEERSAFVALYDKEELDRVPNSRAASTERMIICKTSTQVPGTARSISNHLLYPQAPGPSFPESVSASPSHVGIGPSNAPSPANSLASSVAVSNSLHDSHVLSFPDSDNDCSSDDISWDHQQGQSCNSPITMSRRGSPLRESSCSWTDHFGDAPREPSVRESPWWRRLLGCGCLSGIRWKKHFQRKAGTEGEDDESHTPRSIEVESVRDFTSALQAALATSERPSPMMKRLRAQNVSPPRSKTSTVSTRSLRKGWRRSTDSIEDTGQLPTLHSTVSSQQDGERVLERVRGLRKAVDRTLKAGLYSPA